MADVFISYKAEDRRRIQPLVQALEADGYSAWWDQHIGTGDEWRQTIERQLDEAKCVIVVWSKRSVGPQGQFVRDEASRAQQRRVYVPVTIDTVRIPLGFGESQATSLRGWRGDPTDPRYRAVLSAMRRIVGGGSEQPTAKREQMRVGRRTVVIGGVVAAGAAGLGAWALLTRRGTGGSDSIAVLPFDSLSGDPGQAYFAAGIAGEIRNRLTRVEGLKVAGSTSSEAVGKQGAQTAAGKLGVANILTGNVRQTSSTIRVTAELIDGETGLAKWSQNYDRAPGDVITIQTDIAENVARALAVALSATAKKALAAGETGNIAAQTLVFQARDISYQLTVPALRQSLRLLDRAISLDRDYARAYAMKSFVANNLTSQTARSPAELGRGRDQALRFAKVALSIAPNLPIARSALGFAYALKLQLSESLREHKIALSLASGDPDVIRNYGYAISSIGKPDEALRYVDEALALDPLNSASHRAHVAVLFDSRRYGEAVRYCLKLRRQSPELFRFPNLLAHSLLMLGRTREASLAFGENVTGEALLAARSGNRQLALAKLAALKGRDGDLASFNVARIYAQLGEKDRAFAALDRAWEVRDSSLMDLKIDPYLDPLRNDARYGPLLKRLGIPA
ncbi:MAG TPA: TIR domain-containing protein [Allosphingosinicella sp.]|jgi:serine/threonine-protein kinase